MHFEARHGRGAGDKRQPRVARKRRAVAQQPSPQKRTLTLDSLLAYDIELVVDVRRFPGSRRLRQYAAPRSRLHSARAVSPTGGSPRSAAAGGRRTGRPSTPAGATRPSARIPITSRPRSSPTSCSS
jgi:hypothetical protein